MPVEPNEAPELRQLIKELSVKFDTFIQSLPSLYILRLDYEGWKQAMEARMKTVEDDVKTGREWANREHQGLEKAVQESERRILDKLDEKNTKTWEQRIGHILATFGWIVAIGALLLSYILSHLAR